MPFSKLSIASSYVVSVLFNGQDKNEYKLFSISSNTELYHNDHNSGCLYLCFPTISLILNLKRVSTSISILNNSFLFFV